MAMEKETQVRVLTPTGTWEEEETDTGQSVAQDGQARRTTER